MKYCIYSSIVTFSTLNLASFLYPKNEFCKQLCFYLTIFNFAFNFAYLLLLYAWFETSEYDIDITLLQSLLCLRNISIVIDMYDYNWGRFTPSTPQSFVRLPTIDAFMGYSYCCFTLLVGPSIIYNSYHSIVTDKATNQDLNKRSLHSFFLGSIYLAGYQIFSILTPCSFALTDQFASKGLAYKLAYLMISGRTVLMKYFGVWILVEGASFLGGNSFCTTDEKSGEVVSRLMNFRLSLFESSSGFREIVDSFNIKTNAFGKQYIFKRCAIFKKKWLSMVLTLSFLCIWHGFHYGYYHCFAAEFLLLLIDDNIRILALNPKLNALMASVPTIFKALMLHFIVYIFFVSFELMTFSKTLTILKSVYFLPVFILLFGLILSNYLVKTTSKESLTDGAKNSCQPVKPHSS